MLPDAASRTRLKRSLLDRLTDDNPAATRDDPSTQHQLRREWEQSLLRDVEALLNTKRAYEPVGEEFQYAANSLAQYGLPDFTGLTAVSPVDQTFLRNAI